MSEINDLRQLAANLDEIKKLYLQAWSTRERSFILDNDDQVLEVDDGGGSIVCDVQIGDKKNHATLIAALLNFAAKLADCYDASSPARPA